MIQSHELPPDLSPDVDLLYDYLDRLPHKYREAFLLFEFSGFSLKEIQKLQGGSLSGVKSRLTRAREQLRLWLNDEDDLKSDVKRKEDKQ